MMATANDEFNLYIANRNPWFSNNPLLTERYTPHAGATGMFTIEH